jgi:hypothetical protein
LAFKFCVTDNIANFLNGILCGLVFFVDDFQNSLGNQYVYLSIDVYISVFIGLLKEIREVLIRIINFLQVDEFVDQLVVVSNAEIIALL